MGRYTGVIVGASEVKNVRAERVLPGLMRHLSLNHPGLWTLTQQMSGLALVDGLEEEEVEAAIAILSRVRWRKQVPDDYMENPDYMAVIQEARMLTKHEKSKRQELRLAKELGGKRQPASGSRWGHKRDVITPRFLVEAKTTSLDSHQACVADLEFLRKQAYQKGRVPAYIVEMMDKEEVVLVPYHDAETAIPELADTAVSPMYKPHLTITVNMVSAALLGTLRVFDTNAGKYALIGYERFLALAKWGQDV